MAENQVEQERKRARDLVADIRTEHGVVSTEERNSSHPNVLKGLDSVRRKWAESTKMYVEFTHLMIWHAETFHCSESQTTYTRRLLGLSTS